jgi:hypothetical protein
MNIIPTKKKMIGHHNFREVEALEILATLLMGLAITKALVWKLKF